MVLSPLARFWTIRSSIGFATDAERGVLTCRYSLDGREFAERVSLAPGPGWSGPAAQAIEKAGGTLQVMQRAESAEASA